MKSNWAAKASAVDEIKIFDNDDKAAKHSERKRTFCGLVIIINFLTFLVLGHYFFYTRGVLIEISPLF